MVQKSEKLLHLPTGSILKRKDKDWRYTHCGYVLSPSEDAAETVEDVTCYVCQKQGEQKLGLTVA